MSNPNPKRRKTPSGPLTVFAIIGLGLLIYAMLNWFPRPEKSTTQPMPHENGPTDVDK